MRKLNIDIRPIGIESAIVDAPFDEALALLRQYNFELINLAQNAELRIHQGKDAHVSQNGNRVFEDIIYIPNKGNFLSLDYSPIAENAKQATDASRQGRELYLDKEQTEKALQDSVAFPDKTIEIPTNRFNSEKLTVKAFGRGDAKKAQDYGDFLREAGINEMPVWVVEGSYMNNPQHEGRAFTRKVWLYRLDYDGRSYLDGDVRSLNYGSRTRGVRQSFSEAQTQKISGEKGELYDASQINRYKQILQGVRSGEIPASQLEEVLSFVRSLGK